MNVYSITQSGENTLDEHSGRQQGKERGLWHHTGHVYVIVGRLLELWDSQPSHLWNVGGS